MRHFARKELHWNGYDLMFGDRRMIAIYQKDNNPKQFQIGWNDGSTSDDFYNIEHAKENSMKLAMKMLTEEAAQDSQETPLGGA